MESRFKLVISALAFGLLTLFHAAPAAAYSSAPLTLCNRSPVMLTVAIGYHTPGVSDPSDHSVLTGPFVTRGWYRVQPGACGTYENPFSARYIFWYGFSTQFNNNSSSVQPIDTPTIMGGPWYCVPNYFRPSNGFTFEEENVKDDPSGRTDHCIVTPDPNGPRIWVKFRVVDTWISPNVEFTGQ